MKHTYMLILAGLLITGCSNSAPEQAAETAMPSPVGEEDVTEIIASEELLSFHPQEENVRYRINDQTALHLTGSVQEVPYCQSGSCIVYDRVLLEGAETTELDVFEDMDVKINSEYGMCVLQQMDDLWFFSYNCAAQFGGTYAVLFDADGKLQYEFRDADITMNTNDLTKFLVSYPCGRNNDNCTGPMGEHETDIFDVNGSEVLIMPYDNELDQLRYNAAMQGSPVSVAVISGIYGTVIDTFEATIYKDLYPFMSDIDYSHIVVDDGDMLICVVPTDPNASVSVNNISDINDPEVLYRSESGEPVFIVCSLDDPVTSITVTDSSGNTVSFLPEDYSKDPSFNEGGLIHNFTYDAEPVDVNSQGLFDTLLADYPELTEYASGPDNWTETIELEGKTCYIAYFGTIQPNGWFTRERTFAVAEDHSRVYEYNVVKDVWEYYE
ncbi:MAG: hypothetical protein Q4D24_11375 [Erysipelotrichaceae bacterium]|nr:hypothetical protein [Erysipelotrichaceae bacterium]